MKAPEVLSLLSEKCRRKHLSYATEKSYAGWAQSYIRVLPKYPKVWASEKKVETFLTGLAKRDVAAATQNDSLAPLAHPLGLERVMHFEASGMVFSIQAMPRLCRH
jgi:hypothetical protein